MDQTEASITREQAEQIVDAILHDMDDRGGLSFDDVDKGTRREIREKWITLALQGSQARVHAAPWWIIEEEKK